MEMTQTNVSPPPFLQKHDHKLQVRPGRGRTSIRVFVFKFDVYRRILTLREVAQAAHWLRLSWQDDL